MNLRCWREFDDLDIFFRSLNPLYTHSEFCTLRSDNKNWFFGSQRGSPQNLALTTANQGPKIGNYGQGSDKIGL